MTSVLLVGCGNMGYAMMTGWLGADVPPAVHVVEPDEGFRARAAGEGASAVADADALPDDLAPDLVFLAVKPQIMGHVAPNYARFASNTTFVSIAAGTTIASLEASTGPAAIIRCMPNTPAAIGKGMMVCCANDAATPQARILASELLAASGAVTWIEDEGLMDAVTAISGSGPAYVFHLIECLASAARSLDLPDETALLLARHTVMGAGALAASSDTDPGILRQQVTSPGGTTAAALEVLMGEPGLQALLTRATTAARDRGRELAAG